MASSHAHTRARGFSQNPLSTSPTTLRARIYDRRVNHESSKETCRCPSGLSSWFLVKEISIFCPGFYLRLKERMTSIKNRGHPRGYCRRDHTTSFQFFLLQFSFETFNLFVLGRISSREKLLPTLLGLYNLFPHYYTLQFSLSPKNFLPRLPLPK